MSSIGQQLQSPFFRSLPPEVRNKIYEEYATEFFSSADSDFHNGPGIAMACRRMAAEFGAIMDKFAARVYYPDANNPFNLVCIEFATSKPDTKNLFVHLVWTDTLRMNFFMLWTLSFYSLSQELAMLPLEAAGGGGFINLKYVQIRLNPAPAHELDDGLLKHLKAMLSHPTLKAVDIYGHSQGCKDYQDQEVLDRAIRYGELSRMVGVAPMIPDLDLLVEFTCLGSTAAIDEDKKRQTATKDNTIKPAVRFYYTITDTRMRTWSYCYILERDSHRRRVNVLVREREENEFRTAPTSPISSETSSDVDDLDSAEYDEIFRTAPTSPVGSEAGSEIDDLDDSEVDSDIEWASDSSS